MKSVADTNVLLHMVVMAAQRPQDQPGLRFQKKKNLLCEFERKETPNRRLC